MKQINIKFMLYAAALCASLSTYAMQTIKMRNALDTTGKSEDAIKRMNFSVFTTNKDIGKPIGYRTNKRGVARLPYAETTHIPVGKTIEYPVDLNDDSAIVWVDYQRPHGKDEAKLTTQELKKILTDKNAVLEFYFEGSDEGFKPVLYRLVSVPPAPEAPATVTPVLRADKASAAAEATPPTSRCTIQ